MSARTSSVGPKVRTPPTNRTPAPSSSCRDVVKEGVGLCGPDEVIVISECQRHVVSRMRGQVHGDLGPAALLHANWWEHCDHSARHAILQCDCEPVVLHLVIAEVPVPEGELASRGGDVKRLGPVADQPVRSPVSNPPFTRPFLVTVTTTVVECVIDPAMPVTVTVYWPGATPKPAPMVRIPTPPAVING